MALLRRHEDEDGLPCRSILSTGSHGELKTRTVRFAEQYEKRRWLSRLGGEQPDKKDPDKYFTGSVDDHADRRCRGRRMQPAE